MTREEEIREALNLYAPSSWDFRGEIVPMSKDELQASHEGFVRGAKWADANPKQGLVDLSRVWHDAKEEPKKGEWILGEYQGDIYQTYLCGYVDCEWSSYVEVFSLIRWAYIKDLMPKGGER